MKHERPGLEEPKEKTPEECYAERSRLQLQLGKIWGQIEKVEENVGENTDEQAGLKLQELEGEESRLLRLMEALAVEMKDKGLFSKN